MSIGVLLLLLAVAAWSVFQQVLVSKGKDDSLSSYIVIGKKVTDDMMGRGERALFSPHDVEGLRKLRAVQDLGPLTANVFPVSAQMGGRLGFYTEMFLGAVEDKYLDVLPEEWSWQPGQPLLPIIVSNDFLHLYNYGFALSQGLPQLSPSSIKALPFEIDVDRGKHKFRARIVGFTDRVGSVLVPLPFMQAMNREAGQQDQAPQSRWILKVNDPSDKDLVDYLEKNGYTTNEEQLKWSKARAIVQVIVSFVGIVALVVIGMSVLSFVLFVETTVRRSAAHIVLMKQLGYASRSLGRLLFGYFFPWMASAVLLAVLLALGTIGLGASAIGTMGLEVHWAPQWKIALVPIALFLILFLLLRRTVRQILQEV